MKYFFLFLLIFSFWIGRLSVNSQISSLNRQLNDKKNEYSELLVMYTDLEEKLVKYKNSVNLRENKPVESRLPAAAVLIESRHVDLDLPKPITSEKKTEKKDNVPKDLNLHLEKVMKYVQYLNESDSGTIISFLKKQKAPDKESFKQYNDEIDTTISKVPVRCEAYMDDCFDTGSWDSEQEEVVFCATQFSHCLKNDQYQEIKPSELNSLGYSL